MKEAGFRF